MVDFHLHTNNSGDSQADILWQCAAAWRAGLCEICFTDHVDLKHPFMNFEPHIPKYLADIERARAAFPRLQIRIGLELGDDEPVRLQTKAICDKLPLDFLLLSRHVVDGVDPYGYREYFPKYENRKAAYLAYVAALVRTADAWDGFSSFAHLGYVCKKSPYPPQERPLRYLDAPDEIDHILRRVLHVGAALEVNTSGYLSVGMPIPGPDILARYRALGGEMITLGSDAHDPARVAQHYGHALALLRDVGFSRLTVFRERRPVLLPL